LVAPFLILQLAPESEFGQSLCPHKMLTGFPCPGCGITRSIMALYRGDLSGSFAYHAFGVPLVLACVVGIVGQTIRSPMNHLALRAAIAPIIGNEKQP
jgi:hypothetical protein